MKCSKNRSLYTYTWRDTGCRSFSLAVKRREANRHPWLAKMRGFKLISGMKRTIFLIHLKNSSEFFWNDFSVTVLKNHFDLMTGFKWIIQQPPLYWKENTKYEYGLLNQSEALFNPCTLIDVWNCFYRCSFFVFE